MRARLHGPTNLLFLHTKLLIEPVFPCLADEIAEPRPDVNIKVAPFTESKKFYYTTFHLYLTFTASLYDGKICLFSYESGEINKQTHSWNS